MNVFEKTCKVASSALQSMASALNGAGTAQANADKLMNVTGELEMDAIIGMTERQQADFKSRLDKLKAKARILTLEIYSVMGDDEDKEGYLLLAKQVHDDMNVLVPDLPQQRADKTED